MRNSSASDRRRKVLQEIADVRSGKQSRSEQYVVCVFFATDTLHAKACAINIHISLYLLLGSRGRAICLCPGNDRIHDGLANQSYISLNSLLFLLAAGVRLMMMSRSSTL